MPDLKPPAPPPPPAPSPDGARGGRRGASTSDLSGTWTLDASIAGNPLSNECTLKQEGQKVSGSCTGPRGKGEITGEVNGDNVTLSFGMGGYELVYSGTLEASGSAIKGSVSIAGVSGDFSATRK
jgi:hypothetical protein